MLSTTVIEHIEQEYITSVDKHTYYVPGNLVRWIPILLNEIKRLGAELENFRGGNV